MKVRGEFLAAHPFCQWTIDKIGLNEQEVIENNGRAISDGAIIYVPRAEEIHHKRKRGKYLCDATTFMAVCREAHIWIHNNPRESREKGYLY